MKLFLTLFLVVSALFYAVAPGLAQQADWIPHGVESLGQQASSRTEFTLDRSMLVFAAKMDQDNDELQRVIAGVNGVSVHSFRFPGPGLYNPSALVAIKEQYHAAGWNHLVSDHGKNGGNNTTDLWIRFDKGAISNIAFLFAGETQLNLVAVSGSISPLDLFHLSGHFGIPKMDGGAVVPIPDNKR